MAYADEDIALDFLHDWAEKQREALRKAGYTPSTDNQKVSFQFFNMRKRLVEPRPRRVHEAKGIVCPPDLQDAYTAIKEKIERGEELRPHLSRGLTNLDFDDMLVNDWAIYHLHLSTTLEGDGFVKRTGPVLFARFDADDAYLITIERHGKSAPNVWTNQNMLKTLRDNWPNVIERYVVKGVVGLSHSATDDELRQARKAGLQTLIQVGGVVLHPMGGGYSTAGIAIEVVMTSDRHMEAVAAWEKNLVANKKPFFEELEKNGVTLQRPAKLALDFDADGNVYAVGTKADGSKIAIRIAATI